MQCTYFKIINHTPLHCNYSCLNTGYLKTFCCFKQHQKDKPLKFRKKPFKTQKQIVYLWYLHWRLRSVGSENKWYCGKHSGQQNSVEYSMRRESMCFNCPLQMNQLDEKSSWGKIHYTYLMNTDTLEYLKLSSCTKYVRCSYWRVRLLNLGLVLFFLVILFVFAKESNYVEPLIRYQIGFYPTENIHI